MVNVGTTETLIYTSPENVQYTVLKLLINEKSGTVNTLSLRIYKAGETTPEKTIDLVIDAYDTFDITIKLLPGRELKGIAGASSIQVEPTEVKHY